MALFTMQQIKDAHREAGGRRFDGGKQPGCGPFRWSRTVYTLADGSALFVESCLVWGSSVRTWQVYRAYEDGEIDRVNSDLYHTSLRRAHSFAREEKKRLATPERQE